MGAISPVFFLRAGGRAERPESDMQPEESEAGHGLGTRRLIMRAPAPADAEAFEAISGRPGNPGDQTRNDLADARAWMARARLTPGACVYTLIDRQSGRIVGAAGISPMADQPERMELSLWIGEPHAGRGYGTEAAQAVIDRAFAETGLTVLWGVARVTNSAARRVMEKCGFQSRERGMARSVALRGAVPVERFALERRIWTSLRSWSAEPIGAHRHAPAA
jgi:RimJ/RimL family protein N-acetyltransferase